MNSLIETDNRCHQCKKLFCCANCRELHEKKKHPKPKTDTDCRLCLSKELPLERFKNPAYLCHLVIRHLPLICVLCGQIYRNSLDLETFVKCEYWSKKNRNLAIEDPEKKLPVQATPSPIVKTLSCPATIYQKESPREDSEFHTLESFTSPPELMRNTSTPMHTGVAAQRLIPQFKTPKAPAFFHKTPLTPTVISAKKKPTVITVTNSNNETNIDQENPSPTLFYSATSQLLNSKDINTDTTPYTSFTSGSRSAVISGNTPSRSTTTPNRMSEEGCGYSREFFRSNSGRTLEVMEEQEEQALVSMDLTDAQDNIYTPESTDIPIPSSTSIAGPAKDVPKKVRFSDQHEIMAENTVDVVSDNEEFYEAREIPAEKSAIEDKKYQIETQMVQENEDNSDKENLQSPEDSKVFKTPSDSSPATSSRVVMMVVVENGLNISTSSLVPLINSSLQNLERKPLAESITASIASISNQVQATPSGMVRSVSSVDTYRTSSTVDYYSSELSRNLTTVQSETGSTTASGGNGGGGGILSAMAQVMRYAFRGLPGAASSRDSPPKGPRHVDPRSSASGSSGSRTSPSSFSTIATSLLRRPGKRSRDPVNDAVFAHRRELRSPRNETGTSPVAKRPRSWHRIRGREPIARMRRDTPPAITTRGVSSETQQFQTGSLSVGDTVLPLPSRAHQSTQTD